MDLDDLQHSPFLVGAAGAAVTALRFTPGSSVMERCVNIVVGALVAGFVAPALVVWVQMTDPVYQSAGSFLCGMFGMSLMAGVMEYVRSGAWREVLAAWASKR